MKKVIICLTFMLSVLALKAQDFTTAVGIRGGVSQGLTLKHFVGGKTAFDIIVGTYSRGMHAVVLYEIHHHSIFDVPNLSLFYGFGGHVGFFDRTRVTHWGTYDTDNVMVIGADLVLGIEYTFDEIPINVGIDIKPALNIIPSINYWQGGALYLRYVFR